MEKQKNKISVNPQSKDFDCTSPKTKKPRTSFTSYLTHKQCLTFTPGDFDWLHIQRLEIMKKEEIVRLLRKREIRTRNSSELDNFIKGNDLIKISPELFSSSGVSSDESSVDVPPTESEDKILKKLWVARKKEYCSICDGLCRLFQRNSQRYYDYHNHHFLRFIRELRKSSLPGNQVKEQIPFPTPEVNIDLLYGRSEAALTFLRSYKIPKIKNRVETVDDSDSGWDDDQEDQGLADCALMNTEDCDRSIVDHPLERPLSPNRQVPETQRPKKQTISRPKKQIIQRPKRESKFVYKDKHNSSDDESEDEEDLVSGIFPANGGAVSGISLSFAWNINSYSGKQYTTDTNLHQTEETASMTGINDDEDVLSLYADDEELGLPRSKNLNQGHKLLRG